MTFQYVESLESSVRDLQSKVSSLQQENAALKERPMVASPSLEEREAKEVMTLKVKLGHRILCVYLPKCGQFIFG